MTDKKESTPLTPVEYLAQYSSDAATSFQSLRNAVLNAGPLDTETSELITLGAFATTGAETSFKTHAKRLLKAGTTIEALRQAVMVTFAATTTFSSVITALHWVDDLKESE